MTTKGVLQEALRSNEYWRLADVHNNPPGLIGWWKQKSITFLDNHDTHHNSQNLWPFPYDRIVDGYVYILTHPGIPMVYWDDFLSDDLNDTITRLTQIRKLFNINMNSSVNILNADNEEYCVSVDDRIQVIISHKLNNTLLQNRIKEKDVLFRSKNCIIHSLK
jgi:alpha-amylase